MKKHCPDTCLLVPLSYIQKKLNANIRAPATKLQLQAAHNVPGTAI
jgi:hypothetical protein